MRPNTVKYPANLKSTLHDLISQGENLELTTCYKGLNLTRSISHMIIEDDCIHFKLPFDISGIRSGHVFHLKHPSLANPVIASVTDINLLAGVITASDFTYSDHPWAIRQHPRVQPNHPVRATLSVSQRSLSTCVIDLSEDGLGLVLYHMHEKGFELKPDTFLQIGIRIPNSAIPLLLHASITRIQQVGKSAMAAIGLRLMPTEKQSHILKSFVNLRQAEILEEFTNSIHLLMEPTQTKDLYF